MGLRANSEFIDAVVGEAPGARQGERKSRGKIDAARGVGQRNDCRLVAAGRFYGQDTMNSSCTVARMATPSSVVAGRKRTSDNIAFTRLL